MERVEDWALSHVPLVWMVHEAQRAGLRFDADNSKQFQCFGHSIADRPIADGDASFRRNGLREISCMTDEQVNERSEFEYALDQHFIPWKRTQITDQKI